MKHADVTHSTLARSNALGSTARGTAPRTTLKAARTAALGAALSLAMGIADRALAAPDGGLCAGNYENSCWSLQNATDAPVTIVCEGESYGTWIQDLLGPGEGAAHRFDAGWGDGLGFPEPNVGVLCHFELSTGRADLQLRSLGWGDQVSIWIEGGSVVAVQSEFWGSDATRRTDAPVE